MLWNAQTFFFFDPQFAAGDREGGERGVRPQRGGTLLSPRSRPQEGPIYGVSTFLVLTHPYRHNIPASLQISHSVERSKRKEKKYFLYP